MKILDSSQGHWYAPHHVANQTLQRMRRGIRAIREAGAEVLFRPMRHGQERQATPYASLRAVRKAVQKRRATEAFAVLLGAVRGSGAGAGETATCQGVGAAERPIFQGWFAFRAKRSRKSLVFTDTSYSLEPLEPLEHIKIYKVEGEKRRSKKGIEREWKCPKNGFRAFLSVLFRPLGAIQHVSGVIQRQGEASPPNLFTLL